MLHDRPRSGVTALEASLSGAVVAAVGGTVGICAHGLATPGAPAPGTATVLTVLALCVAVGSATAALCGRGTSNSRWAVPVGVLTVQGLVHLLLVTLHGGHHAAAGHGHAAAVPGAAREQAATLRVAMDAGGSPAGDHWSAAMAAAHLLSVPFVVAVLAVLGRTIAWVAARVAPLVRAVHASRTPAAAPIRERPRVAVTRHLVSRGGTRAPPLGV